MRRKSKRAVTRMLAIMLSFAILLPDLGIGSMSIYAAEPVAEAVESDELVIAEDSFNTAGDQEVLTEEPEEISEEQEEAIAESEEIDEELEEDDFQQTAEDIKLETEEKNDADLSLDEQNAKASMTLDTLTIASSEEGSDYAKDEVIYLCDSLEDAERVAEEYSLATGFKVTVDSYAYGVAILSLEQEISGSSMTTSTVETMLQIASDMDNNLPAVYANYSREMFSANEHFADPFLKESSEYYQWYHELIDDKFVWNKIESGAINPSRVTVAVIDTGINRDHAEFAGAVTGSLDFTSGKAGVTASGDNDKRGHGTNVSGIITAANNSAGGRGVAAGVKILSLKVFPDSNEADQTAEDADIIRAMNYVNNNGKPLANVINMSLGGNQYSGAYIDVITRLNNSGVTIVAAAGNYNTSMDTYPAAFEHVIAVAALNKSKTKASYSNYGKYVDIAAPGGDMISGKNALGFMDKQYIWGPGITQRYEGQIDYQGSKYLPMCGTSQAAPIVAAVAALLYAQNPDIMPYQVESALEQTATPVKSSHYIGAGCINVAGALGIANNITEPIIVNGGDELESGAIDSGTQMEFLLIPDADIYYSVDGKNPNPANVKEGKPVIVGKKSAGTYLYNPYDPLVLEGTGKITIKAVAKQYSKLSPIKSYSYTFNEALVNNIEIYSVDSAMAEGVYQLAIGKKISLKALVEPNYAANKKIKWTSSDSSVATVDANGNVTGKEEGRVIITASSTDGSFVECEARIKVLPLTKSISIDEDYKIIEMFSGESMTLPQSCIHADPAAGLYIFTSSKPKVATVDSKTGMIKAHTSGSTVITVMAGDGSKVKATITLKVKTLVSSIEIKDAKGLEKVAEGKKIIPKVIFNGGKSKPDNSKLEWSIVEGSDYATIDSSKGTVTAKSNIFSYSYQPKTVKIKAMAMDESETEGIWDIKICPLTKSIGLYSKAYPYYVNDDDNIIDGKGVYTSVNPGIDKIVGLTYKSSNSNIVAIDENGYFRCLKKGKAKITVSANDGSGKKAAINIIVNEVIVGLGIESPMEHNVLYPGKSLTFKVAGKSVPSIYKKHMRVMGVTDNGSANSTQYVETQHSELNISGMKVSASSAANSVRPGTTRAIASQIKGYFYISGRRIYYQNPINLNKTYVELYPAGTASINVDKEVNLLAGEKRRLKPASIPENACQKYYSFSSSNTKVAKVDSTGTIVAVSKGTAKITVTAGDGSGKKAVTTVKVITPISSISISTKSGYNTVAGGGVIHLVSKTNADASIKNVSWFVVEGEEYVSVDQNGAVQVKDTVPGKTSARIKAVAADGYGASSYYDLVIYPKNENIIFSGDDDKPIVHEDLKPDITKVITVKPSNSQALGIFDVSSSNKSVVKCEIIERSEAYTQIKITAVGEGSATVTAAATDGSSMKASITVSVGMDASDKIAAFQKKWPEGTKWDNSNFYEWMHSGLYSGGYGCAGFAFMESDAVYGKKPAKIIETSKKTDIRKYDIVRVNGDSHSIFITDIFTQDGKTFYRFDDGNVNGKVRLNAVTDFSKGSTWEDYKRNSGITSIDYIIRRY